MMSRPPLPLPAVTIGDTTIKGKTHIASGRYPRAVDAFYGVPYGRVPTRFQPAVPLHTGASGGFTRFNASKANAQVNNQPTFTAASAEAEKTLTLNIFRPSLQETPAGDAQEAGGAEKSPLLLPVVVYVHGGGFNFGEPLERDHVAHVSWASHESKTDMIIVAICYRLGALGFLSGDEEQDKSSSRELNLGLKDQRLAIEWVRAHISAFGGDADNVTLMGVSAGAHSIGHHILDPRPQPPLFHKAILESGSATARSVLSAGHPRIKAHAEGLRGNVFSKEPLETLDVATVLQASVMVWADHQAAVTWPFQPVVEDINIIKTATNTNTTNSGTNSGSHAVIPDTPLKLWEQFSERILSSSNTTTTQNISIITGFCSHEGTSFVPSRASTNADFRAFFATLIPSLSTTDLDNLEALYPDPVTDPTSPYQNDASACVGKGAQYTRLHEAYAHYGYICPVLHTAHMLSTIADRCSRLAGAGAGQKKPVVRVYLYEYAALAGANPPAAGHGNQAPIVAHDVVQLHGRPGLNKVAEEMHKRWTAFAVAKEGGLGEEVWPEFKTPFSTTTTAAASAAAAASGGEREEGRGKLLVFGKGNDEMSSMGGGRGGRRNAGVAVQERVLTEREREQCRFWWERMELSQGMGERGGEMAGDVDTAEKL